MVLQHSSVESPYFGIEHKCAKVGTFPPSYAVNTIIHLLFHYFLLLLYFNFKKNTSYAYGLAQFQHLLCTIASCEFFIMANFLSNR